MRIKPQLTSLKDSARNIKFYTNRVREDLEQLEDISNDMVHLVKEIENIHAKEETPDT